MHIAKTKLYVHWSRVTDTVFVIYCRLEWNWWSQVESVILAMVDSGSQLGQIRYHQQLRVCSESEGWSGIDRKLIVLSGVNDTHCG